MTETLKQAPDIEVHFTPDRISELPEELTPAPLSPYAEEIVPDHTRRCGFLVRCLNTQEVQKQFRGATVYIKIPGHRDLLDMVYLWGEADENTLGYYSGSNNCMFISQSIWSGLSKDAAAQFRQSLETDSSPWGETWKQQDDTILSAQSEFGCQATELHEIIHRLHWSQHPDEQIDFHTDLIQSVTSSYELQKGVERFISCLYKDRSPKGYLAAHTESAEMCFCYQDVYWRFSGIYDPRTLKLAIDRQDQKVSLGRLVSELVAYTSPYLLLDYAKLYYPNYAKLAAIHAQAPEEELSERTKALRIIYPLLKETDFGKTWLKKLCPDNLIQEMFNSLDSRRSATNYLLEINEYEPFDKP